MVLEVEIHRNKKTAKFLLMKTLHPFLIQECLDFDISVALETKRKNHEIVRFKQKSIP